VSVESRRRWWCSAGSCSSISHNAWVGERPTFIHEALLYGDLTEFLAGTADFVRAGLSAGDSVLVAVPEPRLGALRDELGDAGADVRYVDMEEAGGNPGRIIPAVLQPFIGELTRRARVVGEPIWPGRSSAAYAAAVQHEALINLAFAGHAATIRCPIDATRLGKRAVRDAERTHPVLFRGRTGRPSLAYSDPARVAATANADLPPAPRSAVERDFGPEDLAGIRRFVREHAERAGLHHGRIDDLLIAVNEIAGNTVAHADGDGILRIWQAEGSLVCEITDRGSFTDLLAGRHIPAADALGGRGLVMANQLSDLVQLHPGATGTTVRLHFRTPV
jgi:anti-sigma regulatory factor (Ser/Thr protein kinase)